MSSISLNVTYKGLAKKIQGERNWNVSQLVEEAFKRFNLDDDSPFVGEFYHHGKRVDSSLPIRLSGLTNNSKVDFILKSLDKNDDNSVNVKLSVLFPGSLEPKILIRKVNSSITLTELLDKFEVKNDVRALSTEAHRMELSGLSSRIEESNFPRVKLRTLVGLASNASLRLNYIPFDSSHVKKVQEDIVQAQLLAQRERIRQQEMNRTENKRLGSGGSDDPSMQKKLDKVGVYEDSEKGKNQSDYTDKKSSEYVGDEDKKEDKPRNSINLATHPNSQQTSGVLPVSTEELHNKSSEFRDMSVYLPSESPTNIYNNPDDDYEMTVSQAQIYQQIIRRSGTRNIKPAVKELPKRFFIRIRFPDTSILQLNFPDGENVKLGSLVKRLDESVSPSYLNYYNLKFGYPPFNNLVLSYQNNAKHLIDFPDFHHERITLIWEPNKQSSEPYLKKYILEGAKHSSELPEVVLESNRSDLPESDMNDKKTSASSSTQNLKSDSKNGSKVPKWFRMK